MRNLWLTSGHENDQFQMIFSVYKVGVGTRWFYRAIENVTQQIQLGNIAS